MVARIWLFGAVTVCALGACGGPVPYALDRAAANSGNGNGNGNGNGTQDSDADLIALERSGGKKVDICHVPPGNPANMHRISISHNAVDTHVARHGDGVCGDNATDCCGLAAGGSVCTNVTSDRNHCGACGVVCASGQSCSAGMCISSGVKIDAGTAVADAGVPKPDGGTTTPDAGTMTPDAGTTTPDAGTTTPDAGTTTTTPDAGTTTPDAGADNGTPDGGFGSSSCPNGLTYCDPGCINLETNPQHCGGCDNTCPHDQPICRQGQCLARPCDVDSDCGGSEYRCAEGPAGNFCVLVGS